MAYEKRFKAVPPQLFTSNGDIYGKFTIAPDACSLFKVKQQVIINATGQPTLNVEIKRIDGPGTIYIGPSKSNITDRTNLSAYTVALGASIYAIEQPRTAIPEEQIERLTYDEEPTMARRVILVDECGDRVNEANPLPVNATVSVGDVYVQLTDKDNVPNPGDVHDSVRIGDGTDELAINPDGSINVKVESSSESIESIYDEETLVPSGSTVVVTSYTVLPGFITFLQKVDVSGNNIAQYDLLVNSIRIDRRRTWFNGGGLDTTFAFADDPVGGLQLNVGDIIEVIAYNFRPDPGDFNARIQVVKV